MANAYPKSFRLFYPHQWIADDVFGPVVAESANAALVELGELAGLSAAHCVSALQEFRDGSWVWVK